MTDWAFFLFFILICVFFQALFAMYEMAAVSFNKIRLQYYAGKNRRFAKWLSFLLQKPSRLFGTTLIGVNTFLQIGSEASRRFYESIGISPDFAPVTQIFLVLVFAELAPMFASRKHPEHVAKLGTFFIYLVSKVLSPIIFLIDGAFSLIYYFMRKKRPTTFFLSREEVQRAFEQRHNETGDELNSIIESIFSLESKTAKEVMTPLDTSQLISSECSLTQVKHLLSVKYSSFIPIFHQFNHNIVGIAYPRHLLKIQGDEKVIDFSKPPWFITEHDSILEILKQFRRNNQTVAVVLNQMGQAIGFISLDILVDIVFGQSSEEEVLKEDLSFKGYIEKTLSGTMKIKDFNRKFGVQLPFDEEEDLSDMINQILKHHPSKGEVVRIDNFEFTVKEPTLWGAKRVVVKTLN